VGEWIILKAIIEKWRCDGVRWFKLVLDWPPMASGLDHVDEPLGSIKARNSLIG
jgi:hypothetical protein